MTYCYCGQAVPDAEVDQHVNGHRDLPFTIAPELVVPNPDGLTVDVKELIDPMASHWHRNATDAGAVHGVVGQAAWLSFGYRHHAASFSFSRFPGAKIARRLCQKSATRRGRAASLPGT